MMGERRPEVGKVSDGNIKKRLQNIYNIKMFDQAGKNGKVEATAGKHCQFDVPFSVQVSFCFVFVDLPTNPVGECVLVSVYQHPNTCRERSNRS